MSDPVDDLIDYEEDEVARVTTTPSVAVGMKAGPKENSVTTATKEVKKGSYVGIHSTGFRDFLLKPELLRAIVDCGFEHPSEGTEQHTFNYITSLCRRLLNMDGWMDLTSIDRPSFSYA